MCHGSGKLLMTRYLSILRKVQFQIYNDCFNFQICGTFLSVFVNLFFRSRLTLCKCVFSAFISSHGKFETGLLKHQS